MKPDYERIAALERSELGLEPQRPALEMAGHVVLMDSEGREVSDRHQVMFEVGYPRQVDHGEVSLEIRIKGGPITLIPTRADEVRAVAVFDDGSRMPACNPDRTHPVKPGDSFTIVP